MLGFRLQAAIQRIGTCSGEKGPFTSCRHADVHADNHEHEASFAEVVVHLKVAIVMQFTVRTVGLIVQV